MSLLWRDEWWVLMTMCVTTTTPAGSAGASGSNAQTTSSMQQMFNSALMKPSALTGTLEIRCVGVQELFEELHHRRDVQSKSDRERGNSTSTSSSSNQNATLGTQGSCSPRLLLLLLLAAFEPCLFRTPDLILQILVHDLFSTCHTLQDAPCRWRWQTRPARRSPLLWQAAVRVRRRACRRKRRRAFCARVLAARRAAGRSAGCSGESGAWAPRWTSTRRPRSRSRVRTCTCSAHSPHTNSLHSLLRCTLQYSRAHAHAPRFESILLSCRSCVLPPRSRNYVARCFYLVEIRAGEWRCVYRKMRSMKLLKFDEGFR